MTDIKQKITLLGSFVWLLAALFFLYEFFLRTFIGSIADEITKNLHLSAEQLSFIGAAYFLTYGAMQLFVGLFIDAWGVKKTLIIATGICVFGVFIFTLSHHFKLLLVARLLMGFGSAFGFVSLLVLSLNWFPHKHFGFIAGLSQFLGAIGPLLAGGPLVLLLLSLHDNWRIVLGGIGFIGLLIGALISLFVTDYPPKTIASKPPRSKEISIAEKIKKLTSNKQVWIIVIYSLLVNIGLAIFGIVWGTTYLETHHLTQTHAAFIASLVWVGYAIGSPLLGFISDRLKRRKFPLILCACFGLLLSFLTLHTPNEKEMVFYLIFLGMGFASAGQSIAFAILSEHTQLETRALGFGLNNAFIMLSTSLFIAIFGFLVERSQEIMGITNYQIQNFTGGMIMLVIAYFIALILSFFIRETFCKQRKN